MKYVLDSAKSFLKPNLWIFLSILLLLATAALLYAKTLHVPWYLDDHLAIEQNPLIRDPAAALSQIFRPRGIAILSFALNYYADGMNPVGFHLVNLAIHGLCGILVFLLLRRVFPRDRPSLPLIGALLFVAHPLQTESVTYTVQRMTSLSALFFLLSLYLFSRCLERLAAGVPLRSAVSLLLYGGSCLAACCALGTKENAVVLPVAMLLFSRSFLAPKEPWRPLLLLLAPFFLFSLIVTGAILLQPVLHGTNLAQITIGAHPLASMAGVTPLRYFFTELPVFWIYLRLIFIPLGLATEHGYPLVPSLTEPRVLLAGCGLILLGLLAWHWRHQRPRFGFGIAWFFLTLAVESSFIPLDPLIEHRLYLPLLGIIVILIDLAATLPRPALTGGALLLLTALGVLTWQRNLLWNDPVAFYADNLRSYPQSERALTCYSSACINAGHHDAGERAAQQALAINPDSGIAYRDLARIRYEQGRLSEAEALIEESLRRNLASGLLYNILARIRIQQQRYDLARDALISSLDFENDWSTFFNLGVLSERLSLRQEAEKYYRTAMNLGSSEPQPYLHLARLLRSEGRSNEALAIYRAAFDRAPQRHEVRVEVEQFMQQLGQTL